MATKVEMIKELNNHDIDVSDLNYKEIQKIYYSERKKWNDDTNVKEEITDVKDVFIFQDNVIRNDQLKSIIKFIDEHQDFKFTNSEVKYMVNLFNNFYKRAENPNCNRCFTDVVDKLNNLYKKYKQFYD